MLKCLDCGCVFDENGVKRVIQDYGLVSEYCPKCDSPDFEETSMCQDEGCDELFAPSESRTGKLCPKCESEILEPLKDGLKLKDFCDRVNEKEPVNINAFVLFCFTGSEIEHILTEEIKKIPKEVLDKWAAEFVENDSCWFLEKAIKKEVK